MRDDRDYKLDLSSGQQPPREGSSAKARPYLSVLFACCGVYQRVYRSKNGREYHGRCPRCGRTITFPIGPGGTGDRSFVVH